MKSMENSHVYTLKMSEIAQHFSTFPDGTICVGRTLTNDGGGFLGSQNKDSITIENVVNFDVDIMTDLLNFPSYSIIQLSIFSFQINNKKEKCNKQDIFPSAIFSL